MLSFVEKPPRFVPVAEAEERWRQSIVGGQYDPAVAYAVRRIKPEWDALRKRFEIRQQNVRLLTEHVPALEAKAAEARAKADTAQALERKLQILPDGLKVGELREQLTLIFPGAPLQSATQLAGVLLWVSDVVVKLRGEARHAADDAPRAARGPREGLYTTASPALLAAIDDLRARIIDHGDEIKARQKVLDLDSTVERLTATCESLARGERPDKAFAAPAWTGAPQPRTTSELYRESREKLDDAMAAAQAVDKDAIAAANADDQAAIAALQTEMAELVEQTLIAENMNFSN